VTAKYSADELNCNCKGEFHF